MMMLRKVDGVRFNFRAAPHAVPALAAGEERVVFARMYVAPPEAVPFKGEG